MVTHPYHGGCGSPEVDKTTPTVKSASFATDGLSTILKLDRLTCGPSHEFDLGALRSRDKGELLHHTRYTVDEIPVAK